MERDVEYAIGSTIVVASPVYIRIDSNPYYYPIDADEYVVVEPVYEEATNTYQFYEQFHYDDTYYRLILTDSFGGTVTGFVCSGGDGTEESPYVFSLTYAE